MAEPPVSVQGSASRSFVYLCSPLSQRPQPRAAGMHRWFTRRAATRRVVKSSRPDLWKPLSGNDSGSFLITFAALTAARPPRSFWPFLEALLPAVDSDMHACARSGMIPRSFDRTRLSVRRSRRRTMRHSVRALRSVTTSDSSAPNSWAMSSDIAGGWSRSVEYHSVCTQVPQDNWVLQKRSAIR